MRYSYQVILNSFFEGALHRVIKHIAKIAPIKYKRIGKQYVVYADTRDRAEFIAYLVKQLFCDMLMYKYGIPHRFCELSISIKEDK